MNIYLIGMPGCGKSTIGKQLAKSLAYNFLDLDEVIKNSEKMSISEIFNTKSEEYFRKIEHAKLIETKFLKNTIIACGGGTPCYYNNLEWINSNGKSIYLKVEITELFHRLKDDNSRPLLNNNKENSLKQLLKTRNICYEKAQIVSKNQSISELIQLIESTESNL